MNIVLVADQYTNESHAKGHPGALFWVAQYVSSLRSKGHTVSIVSAGPDSHGMFRVPSKKHRLINFALRRDLRFGVFDENVVEPALRDADIVHYITPFALSRAVLQAADKSGIPGLASFVCVPEDILTRMRLVPRIFAPLLYRHFRMRFYKRFRHIHCPSRWIAQQLSRRAYTAQLHMIGNGYTEEYPGTRAVFESKPDSHIDPDQMLTLYEQIIDEQKKNASDAHKIHLRQTKTLKLGEDYVFVNRAPLFVIFSFLFKYIIMYPIFYPGIKLILGFKTTGRNNLALVKKGAVMTSNHVHMMDGPMTTFAVFNRHPVITSIKGNFETPGISFLVGTLGATPIPETPKALGAFFRAMTSELERGRLVQFYPEAALWPGHTQLRPFKNGAFHLAVMADKPVLPMVVKPRAQKGLFRLFKKKPCITVQIGQPIYAQASGSKRARIDALREATHTAMEAMLGGDSPAAPQPKEAQAVGQ